MLLDDAGTPPTVIAPVLAALRVVCAWCLTEMRPGIEPTSHGICERCKREVFRDYQ